MSTPAKLTTQQRQAMFAQATRQNWQTLPQEAAHQGATTLQFTLPKARLLSKIWLDVEATVSIKHSSGTAPAVDFFTPYKLIRRCSLDLNNGFQPFLIGGKELAIYNGMKQNSGYVYGYQNHYTGAAAIPYGYNTHKALTASSSGAANTIKFTMELPVTLNDRDLIGLILLQSAETNVTLSVDIANGNDLLDNATGYTVDIQTVKVKPTVETFSVPAVQEAFPDLSVLKLVNSRQDAFLGSGQNIVKLATGTIYRKLAFYITDADGKPFEDEDFTGNLELVFNQADVNYSIRPETLRHINESRLGAPMPKGVYVFDFSDNGVPNYGGTRDLIDSTYLTEFWVRFPTGKAGKVSIISECITRLK